MRVLSDGDESDIAIEFVLYASFEPVLEFHPPCSSTLLSVVGLLWLTSLWLLNLALNDQFSSFQDPTTIPSTCQQRLCAFAWELPHFDFFRCSCSSNRHSACWSASCLRRRVSFIRDMIYLSRASESPLFERCMIFFLNFLKFLGYEI